MGPSLYQNGAKFASEFVILDGAELAGSGPVRGGPGGLVFSPGVIFFINTLSKNYSTWFCHSFHTV